MDTNPYRPPTADVTKDYAVSFVHSWWESRRWHYNLGLVLAGILAFLCYVTVCYTILPIVVSPASIEINLYTTMFQGCGYLVMMGVANVCYFLGPLSEWVFRPADLKRYRQIVYNIGFWFSVLLPFSIPAMLTFLVLFFPDYWQHISQPR